MAIPILSNLSMCHDDSSLLSILGIYYKMSKYSNFEIRKVIRRNRDNTLMLTIPRSFAKMLNLTAHDNLKVRAWDRKIVIEKLKG